MGNSLHLHVVVRVVVHDDAVQVEFKWLGACLVYEDRVWAAYNQHHKEGVVGVEKMQARVEA